MSAYSLNQRSGACKCGRLSLLRIQRVCTGASQSNRLAVETDTISPLDQAHDERQGK
jgi:hypothetical protein